MTCVLWNAIPRDFENPDGWPDLAIEQCLSQPWTLLVLHDLPNGAMRLLQSFLAILRDNGAHFRQDFPANCIPMRGGRVIGDMQWYVSHG